MQIATDISRYFAQPRPIQWNPVNTTTFGPWKFGRINGVVVLTGEGQIMVQNAFKLHSTTCIPLIRYKSTFLQLINNLTTAIQCN